MDPATFYDSLFKSSPKTILDKPQLTLSNTSIANYNNTFADTINKIEQPAVDNISGSGNLNISSEDSYKCLQPKTNSWQFAPNPSSVGPTNTPAPFSHDKSRYQNKIENQNRNQNQRNFGLSQKNGSNETGISPAKNEYCTVCQQLIPKDKILAHRKEIPHMLNIPIPKIYSIHKENVGFKMLKRLGWQYGTGLGKQHYSFGSQGVLMHPLRTVKKDNRYGIGLLPSKKTTLANKPTENTMLLGAKKIRKIEEKNSLKRKMLFELIKK